ncbi:MAG: hypothetical protein Hals2KO_10720 [Halioglobus sp.]
MHELQRQAYLHALGIDSYVSRGQLPGAAVTRRIAVVRRGGQSSAASLAPATDAVPEAAPAPRAALPDFDFETAPARARPGVAGSPAAASAIHAIRLRFVTIVCGGYLWLEDLADRALASQQLGLVQGMAQALAVAAGDGAGSAVEGRPEVAQFDWPMHNNRQLDNSEQAARAGLAAFIGRRVEQHACRGLIVLGAACETWVVPSDHSVPVVVTLSTAEMLADPRRKVDVWRDLVTLAARH